MALVSLRDSVVPECETDVEAPTNRNELHWQTMAKEGMRWERRLRREKLLGVGAYGRAILVKDSGRSNARLVLKEIEMAGMRKKERDAAKQEAQLLEAMQHPNIVRCCGHFQRESKLCILLDFCSKGDLESLLKHRRGHLLPESCILSFLAQIALGIKHLHGRRILHRHDPQLCLSLYISLSLDLLLTSSHLHNMQRYQVLQRLPLRR